MLLNKYQKNIIVNAVKKFIHILLYMVEENVFPVQPKDKITVIFNMENDVINTTVKYVTKK